MSLNIVGIGGAALIIAVVPSTTQRVLRAGPTVFSEAVAGTGTIVPGTAELRLGAVIPPTAASAVSASGSADRALDFMTKLFAYIGK